MSGGRITQILQLISTELTFEEPISQKQISQKQILAKLTLVEPSFTGLILEMQILLKRVSSVQISATLT